MSAVTDHTATATTGGSPQAPVYIGRPVLRREDRRFLTGKARYTEDIVPAGLLHASIVRSTEAHADIVSVDVSEARKAPGVVAVYSEADFPGAELPVIPTDWTPIVMTHIPTRYALARGRVRFVGEAIAVVVARTRAQADDAAALVNVDYSPLPVVVDSEEALKEGAPLLHEDFPGNLAFAWHMGPPDEAYEEAAATADFVIELRLENQRITAASMEGRATIADYDPGTGRLKLTTGTQNVHVVKRNLSLATGIPEHLIQVVAPAVGGGFGAKLCLYPEDALLAVVSRRLEKPVRWAQTRSEDFAATSHGRDHVEYVKLAANNDGTMVALKVDTYANVGGYISGMGAGIPTVFSLMAPGCYAIPVAAVNVLGCLTNTTTTETYRGAGRPEAAYLIERAADALAVRLGVDVAEIRRRNFVQPDQFPFLNGVGFPLDSGNYEAGLDMALDMLDYETARKNQEAARAEGRLVGIGLGSYVEFCGFGECRFLGFDRPSYEQVTISVSRMGKVAVQVGIVAAGQGHETSIAQVVAEELGLPIDDIDVLQGDTDVSQYGTGTFNSRSMSNAGSGAKIASQMILDKARAIAAFKLECGVDDLTYSDQTFAVKGVPAGPTISFAEVAQSAVRGELAEIPEGMDPTLKAVGTYRAERFTSPFGTHVAQVEVDPETGAVDIQRYIAVDDCGTIVNPLLVTGQVHGGIAQGIGQVLMEHITFDDNGQPTSGTFMDYAVPKAHQMPYMETAHTVTPSPLNPLGAKGIGESGVIGPPPAVTNAVLDALRPLGVTHIDMPLTPARVWAAIQGARS